MTFLHSPGQGGATCGSWATLAPGHDLLCYRTEIKSFFGDKKENQMEPKKKENKITPQKVLAFNQILQFYLLTLLQHWRDNDDVAAGVCVWHWASGTSCSVFLPWRSGFDNRYTCWHLSTANTSYLTPNHTTHPGWPWAERTWADAVTTVNCLVVKVGLISLKAELMVVTVDKAKGYFLAI